jgi:sulfur relay protein TusB/DsrH
MRPVCLLITSPPTSPEGRQALDLASAFLQAGSGLTLCALQDAVVLACRKQPDDARQAMERFLAQGVTVCVPHEDLALRGLASTELLEPVTLVDYRKIAELLADDRAHVIGCM